MHYWIQPKVIHTDQKTEAKSLGLDCFEMRLNCTGRLNAGGKYFEQTGGEKKN
jgi:hypothetical protein